MSDNQEFVIKNGILMAYNGSGGEAVIPDEVTRIRSYAFSGCAGLTSVVFPEKLQVIPEGVCRGCVNLTRVVFPDGLRKIEFQAFADCPGLMEVSLPSGLQSIENAAFIRCTGLTGVTAPDGIVKIGGWAFHSCAALKRVSLPAGLPILGERAFEGCRELTEIEFRVQSAQDVRYTCQDGMVRSDGGNTLVFALGGLSGPCRIPEGVRYVGEYAFARCEKITEVTVPDSVELFWPHAFQGCTGLKKLTLPDALKRLSAHLCDGCTALEQVNLPNTLTWVDEYAFAGTRLEEADLPAGVVGVGPSAFAECPLRRVTIHGPVDLSQTAFRGVPEQVECVCQASQIPLETMSKGARDLFLHTFARNYQRGREDAHREAFLAYLQKNRRTLWRDKALLPVILQENYITAKEYQRYVDDAAKLGDLELSAALLEYRDRSLSQEELDRISEQKFQREVKSLLREKPTAADLRKLWKTEKREDGLAIILYKGTETDVMVPDRIGKSPVKAVDSRAFSETGALKPELQEARRRLVRVTVPEGVEELTGTGRFEGCSRLKELVLPASVTKIEAVRRKLTIRAPAGSYAERYAQENGLPFRVL